MVEVPMFRFAILALRHLSTHSFLIALSAFPAFASSESSGILGSWMVTVILAIIFGFFILGEELHPAKRRLRKEGRRKELRQLNWSFSGTKELDELQKKFEEDDRKKIRDAPIQETPFGYSLSKHAANTLALRYGIVHMKSRPENQKDATQAVSDSILLRKLGNAIVKRRFGDDGDGNFFFVEVTEHRKRRAVARIVDDTVVTFYPLSDEWFDLNYDLEEVLKDNHAFSLKEIAMLHVTRAKFPSTQRPSKG